MNRPMGGWLLSYNVTMPDRPTARPFLRLSPANEKKCPSWLNTRIDLKSPLMPVLLFGHFSSLWNSFMWKESALVFMKFQTTIHSFISACLATVRAVLRRALPRLLIAARIYLAFMWQNQHKNTQSSEWGNQTLGSFTAEDGRRGPVRGGWAVSNHRLQWSEVLPGRRRNKTVEWSSTIMQWSPRYPAKCANQNLVYQINTCGQQIALPSGGQRGVSKAGREETDKRQCERPRAVRLPGTSWVI